jgi:hypothetical protein
MEPLSKPPRKRLPQACKDASIGHNNLLMLPERPN